MAVPNRLARSGEELVVHRFPTGALGLASPAEFPHDAAPGHTRRATFWAAVKEFFAPVEPRCITAVCIPPGARLMLHQIPAALQKELGVGADEPVTFTQISAAANTYRDAVRFAGGREVRLQQLREGQPVEVLDMSAAEEFAPLEFEYSESSIWP